MDDERVPAQVALVCHLPNPPRRVAVFRWVGGPSVSLTVYDQEWGVLARDYLANGVPLITENRRVPASEPAAFMRALLGFHNMSYYSLVDES